MDCRTTPVTSSYLDIQVAASWLRLYPSSCVFFAPVPPPWFSFYNVWLDDFQPFNLSSKLILKQEAAVLLALKCVLKWTGVTWQDINDCLQKLQPPTLYVLLNDSLWKLRTLKCLVLNVATEQKISFSGNMIQAVPFTLYCSCTAPNIQFWWRVASTSSSLFSCKVAGLISCYSYSDFIVSTSLFVFFFQSICFVTTIRLSVASAVLPPRPCP